MEGSDTKLATVLESMPDGVLVVSPSGQIEAFNHKLATMWGIPAATLASANARGLLRPVLSQLQARSAFLAELRRLRVEPAATTDDILCLKDGRIIECHSAPHLANSQVPGRVWTFRDVTIRANVEAALNEELYLFDVLMESLPEHIYFKDRTCRFTRVNRSMARLFGIREPADLIGKCDFDFFTPVFLIRSLDLHLGIGIRLVARQRRGYGRRVRRTNPHFEQDLQIGRASCRER